ncbi:MAG: lysophospholipid acyltransferase family protein, partial [Pseudomonadota bacterium]
SLVMQNIKTAFPNLSDKEAAAIGLASFRNFAMTGLEVFQSRYTDIAANIEAEGAEHLTAAVAQGNGVYILCCHLGNWEAMGAAINRRYAPTYVIVKKVGSPNVDRFVNEIREHNQFRVIIRRKKGDGARQILETIKRGDAVGFVMDQARPSEPKLPFFGVPAKTNTSFAALHQKRPAPIVAGYMIRTAFGRHKMFFLPALELPADPDPKKEILDRSVFFNSVVEYMVRQAPEHYFWLHNRWKN